MDHKKENKKNFNLLFIAGITVLILLCTNFVYANEIIYLKNNLDSLMGRINALNDQIAQEMNKEIVLKNQIAGLQKEPEKSVSPKQEGMTLAGGNEYSGSVYLKDNIIYSGDKARGFLANDKINIFLKDKVFSFKGDLQKLSFGPAAGMDGNFYYDGLEVSNIFKGPYAIYRDIDMDKITYKCGGSLLVTSAGKQLPNFNCKTNGKDSLSQYEYSAASGNGFATGAPYSLRWYKLYAKNIDGTNFIILGSLTGGSLGSDSSDFSQEYGTFSTQKYLDGILKDEINKQMIKKLDGFVENL